MRSKQTCIAAALIAGAIALATSTSAARPTVSVTPAPNIGSGTAFATAGLEAWADAVQADPSAAHGTGFVSWWRVHGREIAEVVGCALDGAGIGRMLALGVVAGGGAWAAAGLAAATLACLA